MSEWATVLGDKEWLIFFFLKIFSKFVVVSVSAVCVCAVLTVGSNHTLSTSLGGGRDRDGKKLRKKKMFLIDEWRKIITIFTHVCV